MLSAGLGNAWNRYGLSCIVGLKGPDVINRLDSFMNMIIDQDTLPDQLYNIGKWECFLPLTHRLAIENARNTRWEMRGICCCALTCPSKMLSATGTKVHLHTQHIEWMTNLRNPVFYAAIELQECVASTFFSLQPPPHLSFQTVIFLIFFVFLFGGGGVQSAGSALSSVPQDFSTKSGTHRSVLRR